MGRETGPLDGRVAVVTGGARGLGFAIASRFVADGAQVALWDFDGDRVASAVEELGGTEHAVGLQVDVADRPAVIAAAQATREQLGPVAILVNNAGIADPAMPWDVTQERWERVMRVNADGAFWAISAVLPEMRERRYGKIINIGSIAAERGSPGTNPAYAASKAALLGLTISLSFNLGEYGICVNAINPGFIRTEIHESFTEEQLVRYEAGIPLNRGGQPGVRGRVEDVAAAAAYLASPDADYVNGQFLGVNGGAHAG